MVEHEAKCKPTNPNKNRGCTNELWWCVKQNLNMLILIKIGGGARMNCGVCEAKLNLPILIKTGVVHE